MNRTLMGPRMNAVIVQWPGGEDAEIDGLTITTNLQRPDDVATALKITLRALRRELALPAQQP